jgi:hypothetical protein
VVKKGGALEFGFASSAAGDHPPIDLVISHAFKA